MIDVAGLGMRIVRPGQIEGTLLLAQGCEPGPAAVIEHPEPYAGKINAERAGDAAREDVLVLVVGGDQQIDARRMRELLDPGAVFAGLAAAALGARQVDKAEGPAKTGRCFDDRKRPG